MSEAHCDCGAAWPEGEERLKKEAVMSEEHQRPGWPHGEDELHGARQALADQAVRARGITLKCELRLNINHPDGSVKRLYFTREDAGCIPIRSHQTIAFMADPSKVEGESPLYGKFYVEEAVIFPAAGLIEAKLADQDTNTNNADVTERLLLLYGFTKRS